MARSKKITVTPNVEKCLGALEEAVKASPPGDLKSRAESALGYLKRTFKGEPQPLKGRHCPDNTAIIAG